MRRVLVFDVNETLLDLGALDPHFQRVFGDAKVRVEWFGLMLQIFFGVYLVKWFHLSDPIFYITGMFKAGTTGFHLVDRIRLGQRRRHRRAL